MALIDWLAGKLGVRKVDSPHDSGGDARGGRAGISVETMVCSALANLACMGSDLRVEGGSARALMLDAAAEEFCRRDLVKAMTLGLEVGDCLVVPAWHGGGFECSVIPAAEFAILGHVGEELTDVAYVVDRRTVKGRVVWLVQHEWLESYEGEDGGTYQRAVMELMAVDERREGRLPLGTVPEWDGYAEVWEIPNVTALPVARFRSVAVDPMRPNSVYGIPACFGARGPIAEIHYLLSQQHNEFALSEKAVIADKRMFVRRGKRSDGTEDVQLALPSGKERVFMKVNGAPGSVEGGSGMIAEWAPTIQLDPYQAALEQQKQLVELAVGVNGGIISKQDDLNYMNVDNVRKSTIKTQAFIEQCRREAERMMMRLLYAWDVLANVEGMPTGDWSYSFTWSDDYINTFADQRDAIASGVAIGAMDALDYRLFVLGESPEVARERVAEIAASGALGVYGEQ